MSNRETDPECLDRGGRTPCSGKVEFHLRPSDFKSFPRCEAHQAARVAERESSMERYADSDLPPKWFDPEAAGERWDDDY